MKLIKAASHCAVSPPWSSPRGMFKPSHACMSSRNTRPRSQYHACRVSRWSTLGRSSRDQLRQQPTPSPQLDIKKQIPYRRRLVPFSEPAPKSSSYNNAPPPSAATTITHTSVPNWSTGMPSSMPSSSRNRSANELLSRRYNHSPTAVSCFSCCPSPIMT